MFIIKNPTTSRSAFLKNAKPDVFKFLIIDHYYIAFEKKTIVLLFLILKENLPFQKVSRFAVNWLV